jgi:hypothetical protein
MDQDSYKSILHLATLAPVRPERLGRLYRRLALVSHGPGLGRPLLDVMAIHCGRWIVFGNLPHRDGERQRPLNWNYLLFAATYDGPRDAYLNTFADILPLRLAAVFGDCVGFEQRVQDAPGADDRVLPAYAFRDYVMECALPELESHHYVEEPVRTIRQALAMQRVAQRSDLLTGRALEQAQSTVIGMAVAPPVTSPGLRDAVLTQAKHAVRRRHTLQPLTLVAPLQQGERQREWPLDRLPTNTLFARVIELPRMMQANLGHPHPDRLPDDYLVFMTDYYGKQSDYVDALRTNSNFKTILGHCASPPSFKDQQGFRTWITRHSLKTRYYFTGYAPPAIDDLKRLIAARADTAHWALGAGAETLRSDR